MIPKFVAIKQNKNLHLIFDDNSYARCCYLAYRRISLFLYPVWNIILTRDFNGYRATILPQDIAIEQKKKTFSFGILS